MRKTKKSIIATLALSAALMTTVCFSSCTPKYYSIDKLDGDISAGEVVSNGGFVVEKGDYVYFINGKESYTADNTFGDVVKSSLMRIKRADLAAKKYDKAETVVPLLFAAQNVEQGGVYIYGDYVYFATPTTDKDKYGEVQNTMLDFKRAKLDGTQTMGSYFFRCKDQNAKYRFVEVDGTVYCLYTEEGALKSYNTVTGDKRVLVSGASEYFFDMTDEEKGTVYYTMSVTDKADTKDPVNFGYNQIYAVTPDAYASVDEDEASYTVYDGAGNKYRTYDYDKDYLEENNEDFDAEDYTTYPYVNLGKLVVDGIGSSEELCGLTNFNDVTTLPTAYSEVLGYTYTLKSYQNGGLYFTRTKVQGSEDENKIYYLAESKTTAAGWNTVEANYAANLDVVVEDASKISGSVLYDYVNNAHVYYYVNGSNLYKAGSSIDEPIVMSYSASGATLLFVNGGYLYFYAENSSNLSRINVGGEMQADYDWSEYTSKEYSVSTFAQVQFNTAWYKPEFVSGTNVMLYTDAKAVNGAVYNYINALDLTGKNGAMTAEEVNEVVEKYEEITEFMQNSTEISDASIRNAMKYVFMTGDLTALDEVESLYADYQLEEVKAFAERRESTNTSARDYRDMFKDDQGNFYDRETYFVNMIGKMTDADVEQYAENAAVELLQQETETEEEETGLKPWAIVLICVGGALVVAAGITIPLVLVHKKKAKERADREATAVRKRKKIDTTDDKTIDVYGDDKAVEEPPTSEEVQEEVEAPAAEEVSEETAE